MAIYTTDGVFPFRLVNYYNAINITTVKVYCVKYKGFNAKTRLIFLSDNIVWKELIIECHQVVLWKHL